MGIVIVGQGLAPAVSPIPYTTVGASPNPTTIPIYRNQNDTLNQNLYCHGTNQYIITKWSVCIFMRAVRFL